ncbi:hypothetical protein FQ154_09805 [Paeniglutamicibacter gangotriensis]|uniref:Uncharacterized protein n=1 Tax=Paeniglutamicibacter gangotriensis TaxID=254787 RepID=A0A5B0EH72_9MICC|nr:hypothetical protein [Paeniglutamicibacter gangotriensis]KAA0977180.1 hypothetical protein FQ154_09805 [Paeniglutamicibacter gangotriensis]
MGTINAFGSFFSPAIYVTVLSFVAYVVGMTLTVDRWHGPWSTRKRISKIILGSRIDSNNVKQLTSITKGAVRTAQVRGIDAQRLLNEFNLEEYARKNRTLTKEEKDGIHAGDPSLDFVNDTLQEYLYNDLVETIPSLAMKLQERNTALFGEYDRDKSEAEFRLSIAPPVLLLSMILMIESWLELSTPWPYVAAFGILAAVVIFHKGINKTASSRSVVITALEIGVISNIHLERLKELENDI